MRVDKSKWQKIFLGEVCNLYQPKTIATSCLDSNGKYLVYGANGVIGKYNEYNHKFPEVLITCRGATCGTINISKPFSWINGNAMVVHPKEENLLDFAFLGKAVSAIDYSKVITGAAQPQITRANLQKVQIGIPTLVEQQTIASELDAVQEMIDGYKAQIADLDALAQSIFLDMFGDPVTNPKGWNLQTLKEVCSHIVDCPHSTPQKSAIPTEYPCIRTSELTDSGIEWNTMQYLNEEEYLKRTHRLKPQFGDLIYGREGTVGGCIMVPKEKHFSLGQRTMLFRPSKINSYLLLAIIRSPWIRNQAELKTVGQTVKHINIKDIIEFTIPVPPRTLQQHFATQVEAIELQKELLRQQLADAETLMAERMQYYFS